MWKDLSFKDRSKLIELGVSQGILDLSTIKHLYNINADGGSIHIAKNKRGTFKAQASRMGMSTQQAASHILANKDDYSPAMVKKAVFAHNFAHADGGKMYDDGGKNDKYQAPWYSRLDYAVSSPLMDNIRYVWRKSLGAQTHDSYSSDYNDPVQGTFLMPRNEQSDILRQEGYIEGKPNDYGLVRKAVGDRDIPIWQTAPDAISRDYLVPIENSYSDYTGPKGTELKHPGEYPVATYVDARTATTNNPQFYQKAWDLNDYGGAHGSTASIAGKILDAIGSPIVQTTGFQKAQGSTYDGYEDRYKNSLSKLLSSSGLHKYNDRKERLLLDPQGNPVKGFNGKPLTYTEDTSYWGLPEVVVTAKRIHKRSDGGSLESNEDDLLAPIIKYYEDTTPSLSIEDQNTFAKGGQMKRARQAVGYFVNKGLTKAQAAGLVGNLMRESGMNIAATNPNSGAYGLGQWLGNRKTRLFRRYGYHPTFEQQLDYIWDELNTSHRRGLQMLRASKTADDAARNAFGYYEFSAGPEAAVRAMNSAGKNTKWKNPNGTYALNSGIKNAQMIFGEVPVTIDNAGDTLALDTPESTPNIQPIISNDYAPVTTANLKELPTFGQEENNDGSISSFGPQYLAQNLDKLGMTNPLNPFEKGYQLQSPKAIYADMQGLI